MNQKTRTRMDRDIALIEANPRWTEENDEPESRWRLLHEVEEWVYDQAFDSGIEPLWKIAPNDVEEKIGEMYLQEGPKAAKHIMDEEIQLCIEHTLDEWLNSYVDGQMRLFAGYDVAENGDTIEEGEYESWEHLRMIFEAGIQDKLRDNERYESI